VCTGIVSTRLEEIKQHEIITIRGNKVWAGQVPMSAIDMVCHYSAQGIQGVCRQREMKLEDAEECDDV